jgi:3-hydroxybutyryl-CoA dehydrogenase
MRVCDGLDDRESQSVAAVVAGSVAAKSPVGPLGALDAVGLDTARTITDYWARELGDAQLRANAAFLKEYVDRGDLGVKSGRGFYTYPEPAYAQPGFIDQA